MKTTYKQYLLDGFTNHWELPSLTDYPGETFCYKDVAHYVAYFHLMFKEMGLRPGDKIALCGRNSSRWGMAFIAITTYGAVAVPLLHEFTPENIHSLVNHSESKLLFAMDNILNSLETSSMPNLMGVILLNDYKKGFSNDATFDQAFDGAQKLYEAKYGDHITVDQLDLYDYAPDELILINYTSGTTSASKGVMLPSRVLWSNMAFAHEVLAQLGKGDKVVSMLPMAHMYGMAFEFLFEFSAGVHVHFLCKALSPVLILQAFKEVKPCIMIAVPLILEKIVRRGVMPVLQKPHMRILRSIPIVRQIINKQICDKLKEMLGGKFYEVIIGGAAFNRDVEQVLKDIHFPFTVGYGMTECGPIIGYSDWHKFVIESCGKIAPRMEVKILSDQPHDVPGEIVVRGMNVMLGYYKNEEATRQTIDAEGWLHTGDMGVIDRKGNIFIKGRCKNMLLGPSGQNIYPEEIEDAISNLPYVLETVVVQRDAKLYGLVYPDLATAKQAGLATPADVLKDIESHRKELNKTLPSYAQLSGFELVEQEFEKTPKKSIKRFLYK